MPNPLLFELTIMDMKQIIVLLLFCSGISTSTFSQFVIRGQLNGYEGQQYVVLRQPVNGYFSNISYQASDTVPIINNLFNVTINCKNPVFVFLSFSDHTVKLIATPHDTISLILDFSTWESEKKIECHFSGANPAGHKFFYDYDYVPVDKYAHVWVTLKSAEKNDFVKEISNELDRQVLPINNMYKKGLISDEYHALLVSTIKSLLLHEATRKVGDFSLTSIKIKKREERIEVTNKLFNLYSPINNNLYYGLNAQLYANTFFAFQRSVRLNTKGLYIQPDTVIKHKDRKYLITGDFAFLCGIKEEKLKEYLLSSLILACLSVDAEEALKDEIPFFTAYYPNSPFTPIINKYKDCKEIQRISSASNFSKYFDKFFPEILDTAGRIKDFQFLKENPFKGKHIFIDVWATWCAPCLKEMQYNYRVDSFLYSNNAVKIYISIDNPSQREIWEKMIVDMHLGGFHILAGKEFNRFLSKTIGLSEGLLPIPKYIIIRDGKIIVADAARPSDFDKLKGQFSEIIEKTSEKNDY